ncbi:MAG TPA: mechanosensitive ion channel [Clostridiales bacterium]|nr:mechanosensitive ion channel [Clostridiales bacterium]
MERVQEFFTGQFLTFGITLLKAVAVAVVGYVVIRCLLAALNKALTRVKVDYSLKRFLLRSANILLLVVLALSVVSSLGISTSGLLAALSAAAVAVGLALKDSLGNIAGGILLLITKPFLTGDFIEAGDFSGTVLRIDMIHTILKTADNRRIIIPNGQLVNQKVINYSKEENRRLDLSIYISYDSDTKAAKQAVLKVLEGNPLVLREPEPPVVRISGHTEKGVEVAVMAWCKRENYAALKFDLAEQIHREFGEQNIGFYAGCLKVSVINN